MIAMPWILISDILSLVCSGIILNVTGKERLAGRYNVSHCRTLASTKDCQCPITVMTVVSTSVLFSSISCYDYKTKVISTLTWK